MRSEDIKEKKESEEIFEEADPTLFGETPETEITSKLSNLSDKYNKFKQTKWFTPAVITFTIVLFIGIVILVVGVNNNKSRGLMSIDTNLSDIIYLNEETIFRTDAYGEGDLSKTKFTFNSETATLKSLELTGDFVTNTITTTKTGNIYITIKGSLNNKKVDYESGMIAVCNRLTSSAIENGTITLKQGRTTSIGLDLGKSEKCYRNIKYSIENESIAILANDNMISGISKGTTTLLIKDNKTEIKLSIVVN